MKRPFFLSLITLTTALSAEDYTLDEPNLSAATLPTITGTLFLGNYSLYVAVSGSTGVISNNNTNNVTFFDTTTNQISGTVAVGNGPSGVAIFGTTAVVSNNLDSSVSIIDASRRQLIGTISVQAAPTGIALFGTKGLVACRSGNCYLFFDTALQKVTGTIVTPGTISSGPYSVAMNGTYAIGTNLLTKTIDFIDPQQQRITGTTAVSWILGPRLTALSGTTGVVGQWNGSAVYILDAAQRAVTGTVVSPPGSGNTQGLGIQGTTACVASSGGFFNIIDTTQAAVTQRGAIGSFPFGACVDNNKAYIVNSASQNLSIVDLQNGQLSGTVALGLPTLGLNPADSAINQTTSMTSFSELNHVALFDLNNKSFIGTIAVGRTPLGVAMNESTAYVANYSDANVSVIDLQTKRISGTLQSGAGPDFLALSGTTLAVSESDQDTVSLIDINQNTRRSFAVGSYPQGIALKGTIGVVANYGGNSVTVFDTMLARPIGTISVNQSPYEVAISGKNCVVTHLSQNMISIIDLSNLSLTGTVGGFNRSNGVILLGTTAYVASTNSNEVCVCDISTKQITGTISVGNRPTSLSFNGKTIAVTNEVSNSISLLELTSPAPIFLPSFPGSAGTSARMLNTSFASGTLREPLLSFYEDLLDDSYDTQLYKLTYMVPGYKVIQYALEKLDFQLHKQLEKVLYKRDPQSSLGFFTGYDLLHQEPKDDNTGYRVKSFYQMLQGNYAHSCMNYLFALGASESYMSLQGLSGNAKYPTVYGALGTAAQFNRWQVGLDMLFGYSFLSTKRHVKPLSETATSSHGAWNLSFEAQGSYLWQAGKFEHKPYESFSYLYGKENNYKEHSAPISGMSVHNEHISVIRNALGWQMSVPSDLKIQYFLDGAWVYDLYVNDQGYPAAFNDAPTQGTFYQTVPTKNYGRVYTGFKGHHDCIEWEISYSGLFGRRFSENSVTGQVIYKF